MTSVEGHLKTQTVAQELGLSVSTIKRWVDAGTIRASRTVGKHRLIPRSEAVRLATELGIDPRRFTWRGGTAKAESASIDDACREKLFDLLKEGRRKQAKDWLRSVHSSGCGAAILADQVIRPVLCRIGHGWIVGALDIYQEHQASQIVAAAVTELIERAGNVPTGSGPLAVGAVTEGDPYVLSSLLAELLLLEQGWEVRQLGVNLPLRSLANAALEYRPRLIFISVNYLRDLDRFVREYNSFYETAASVNTAVIIGGQALDEVLRSRLVYTAFGDRMLHLAEFARKLAAISNQAARITAAPEAHDRSLA
jgi:excisionase family DNA binding protein